MLLTDFLRSMLRRWYVVVICFVLTAGGAYAVSRTVPATYQSTATVVLLPPASVVTSEGNPYLFMGGLDQALSILAVKLNSAEVSQELVEGDETYEVIKDPSGPGPLIRITTEAATGPGSEEIRDAILDDLPGHLQELQDQLGVATNAQISAMTIVESDEPTMLVKKQMRALLAVAGLGIGLTAWVTGMFDRWLLARAARRKEASDEEDVELSDPPELEATDITDRFLIDESSFVTSGKP